MWITRLDLVAAISFHLARHRGAAGSTTIRSMNLTEELYLPGDEGLRLW